MFLIWLNNPSTKNKKTAPVVATPKRFVITGARPTMTPERSHYNTCPCESLPIFRKDRCFSMAKIISLPNQSKKTEQDQIHWTVLIRPNESNYVSVLWSDTVQAWLLGIYTDSFDKIPELRQKALQEWKIAKALKGGAIR